MTGEPVTLGRLQALMLRMIKGYQTMFSGRPSPCRFYPTCSEYGHEAIRVHGAGRGLWLTVRRLSRCRPFGRSGFDPVPEPRAASDRPVPLQSLADNDLYSPTEDLVMEKTA